MMNERHWLFVLVLGLCAGAMFFSGGRSADASVPNGESTKQVQLGPEFQIVPGSHWLVAFVETGSADKRVHVSLNEAACHKTKTDYRIRHISAAHRQVDNRDGVRIAVLFDHKVPPDMGLHLTITHFGALRFGNPEKWHAPL